jgi:hypothetical protein
MRSSIFCLSLMLAASTATAQRLVVYDPVAAGGPGILELTQPSAMVPAGSPPILIYPEVPVLPLPPAFLVPPGDSTFDGVGGLQWFTNGMAVASMPTPAFPPRAVPLPITPIPNAILNLIGGPVTGMAIDPGSPVAAPILYLVSAPGVVVGVAPNPAMPIAVQPFPVGMPPMAAITGLEWDNLGNQLLACDLLGNVYPFFVGGAPAGPMIPGPAGLPGVAGDVAIDKTGMRNQWGVRPIFVLFGPVFVEVTVPAAVPPAYVTGGSPNPTGMAFLPHPAANPVIGVCPCPNFALMQSVTGAMSAGNLAFGIQVGGLPAGQLVLFAFDFAFNPAWPKINGIGCNLGIVVGSPTAFLGSIFATPAGVATFLVPLRVPPGTGPVYYQGATFCPADPLGIVITPMYQLAASGL